jgi:hypothetical protein
VKHHAKALSAGSTDGSGGSRTLFRRAFATLGASSGFQGSGAPSRRSPLALIAGLVVIASLAFSSTALAATPIFTLDPTPTVGYTTAHVSGTLDPADGEFFPIFRYAHDPDAEGWVGLGPLYETFVPISGAGAHLVTDDFSGLKPGTDYEFRLGAQGIPGEEFFETNPPFPSFTTKAAAIPSVTIDPIATHTDSTAHFSGTVETNAPAGPLDPEAEAVFRADWSFSCNPACPSLTPDAGAGSVTTAEGSKTVSVDASGLDPDTTYEVTLTATNLAGSSADTKSFATTTIPPTVTPDAGAPDGKGGYTLQGVVNPRSSTLSDCKFVYGPNSGATPGDYAFVVPCSPLPGEVNKPVTVEGHVTALTIGATYHARLVVTNTAGTVVTNDQIFVPTLTPAESCTNEALRIENNSLALPECRAYEQVSAPNKTGYPASIVGYFGGTSVAYRSSAGNIDNSGQASTGANFYVTNRTSTGWETIPNLNGPGGSLQAGPEALFGPRIPEYYAEDFQTSLWFTQPGALSNADRQPFLRNPGGSFTQIGAGLPGKGASIASEVLIVGSSTDFSHLVLNGEAFQTPIFGRGLYEFVGTGDEPPRRVDVDDSGDPISECPPPGDFVPGGAYGDAVSKDASVITFTALGGCGGGNPGVNEIWARVDGIASFALSQSRCTRTAGDPGGSCNAPAPAVFAGAAKDGSGVYFTTTQQLVNGDTDQTNDLYVAGVPTSTNPIPSPTLAEVSGAASEAEVEELPLSSFVLAETQNPVSSDDGTTICFVAKGVLAGNEDALEETAVTGDHNLYVWRRDPAHPAGQTKFVGRLLNDDLFVASTFGMVEHPQFTPDGRYLVLATASPLVRTDSDNAADLYRYDTDTGDMTRASVNASGGGGNADGFDATIVSRQSEITRRHSHPAVSDDGQLIVFVTAEALSPLDGNDEADAYLWKGGRVSLLSTGSVGGGVLFEEASIDASGQDVYFKTLAALSPSDGDSAADIYDARVGGGFSFAEAAVCSGEACQGPSPSPVGLPNPATDRAPAPEGKQRPKSCPKGKVAKKGHCVKKKPKKAKRAAKSHHGGAK